MGLKYILIFLYSFSLLSILWPLIDVAAPIKIGAVAVIPPTNGSMDFKPEIIALV